MHPCPHATNGIAAQKEVVATQSTASMDFGLSVMAAIVSSLWALYGAAMSDPFVLVPNAIGSVLGFAQVALFFVFPTGKGGSNPVIFA